MYPNADEARMTRFLADLSSELSTYARQIPGAHGFHNGLCREDAVQDVMRTVIAHVRAGAALENCRSPIFTLADLRKYALGRLRTNLNTMRRGAENDARNTLKYRDAISVNTAAGQPADEHPMYDEEFLKKFLTQISEDPIAHRVALTVMASHVLPGSPDIDVCDNEKIAELTGYTVAQIRGARRRIRKLINELADDDED